MSKQEYHYQREWVLCASPEALWPYLANTHIFNYQSGNPPLHHLTPRGSRLPNGRRRMFSVITEFEEEPFEWVRPYRYASVRRFTKRRVFDVLTSAWELIPQPAGGTLVRASMTATAPNRALAPLSVLIMRRTVNAFTQAVLAYDQLALHRPPTPYHLPLAKVSLPAGGADRLARFLQELRQKPVNLTLIERLEQLLLTADDLALARIRPYALADYWQANRHEVLELCLWSTRLGLLTMQWEVLCPLCRGSKERYSTLQDFAADVHCDSCNIAFTANFAQFVELVFRPNPAVRQVVLNDYCLGGPEITPHVVVQQFLRPGEKRTLTLPLEPGSYRWRALELPGRQAVLVHPAGATQHTLKIGDETTENELTLAPQTTLTLHNITAEEQLFMLERTAWNDQAVTAAEVITRQLFRDLFSAELLRPQERVEVGSVALVFTDLRHSTQLYQQLGDAVAFAQVQHHFELLHSLIAAEGGAIVKTIGDAVMAAFTQPLQALRVVLMAQQQLAQPPAGRLPFQLKAGIHYGPCLAVALNDRLDYFGSNVNLTARLEGLASQHSGLIISDAVRQDPAVNLFLAERPELKVTPLTIELKGFEGLPTTVWLVN